MRTKSNNPKNVRINVRLTKDERKKYKEKCSKDYSTSISKRIRKLINLDIDGNLCQQK
jgi:hypothetical protein